MTEPGWYGESGNVAVERYWDGRQWTPQTRVASRSETGTSLDLGPSRSDVQPIDFLAKVRSTVAEKIEASKHKAIEEPTLCVSGDCNRPRAPGRFLCAEHSALVDSHSTPEQTAIRERMLSAPAPSRLQRAAKALEASQRRPGDANIVCPHCQVTGRVTSRKIKQKKGISGGKATGAIFTGGLSMLGTGLSRKEKATEMRCHNCNTTWFV